MTNYFELPEGNKHCEKCGRELKRGDIVYKMVRGEYTSQFGYKPDWADYDTHAGFIFICEKCSGFTGEWKE